MVLDKSVLPSGHVVSHDGYMSQGDNSYPPNIDANLVIEGIAPNSTVEIEIISLDLYIHPRKLCSDYLEIVGVSRKPMGQQLEKICPRNSGKDNIGSEIVYTLAENIVFRFVSDAYNDRHGGFMLRYNVIDFDPDYVGNTAKSTTTPALKADNSTLTIGNNTVESSTVSTENSTARNNNSTVLSGTEENSVPSVQLQSPASNNHVEIGG